MPALNRSWLILAAISTFAPCVDGGIADTQFSTKLAIILASINNINRFRRTISVGCIETAAEWIHANWDKIPHGPDPNASDILYVASAIHKQCQPSPGKFGLNIEEAQKVLKEVGGFMLDTGRVVARGSDPVIRRRSLKQLTDELITLQSSLAELSIASIGSGEKTLVSALFLYGSYLVMAKDCRHQDSIGNPVDRENSLANYNNLSETSKTNSWVRAGAILVRLLRPNAPMVEDWIPKGTPY